MRKETQNMNKNDIIINYAKAQELGCVLRCPCCGKFTMNQHIDNNSISRLADIYICNDCGADEAVAELENKENNAYIMLKGNKSQYEIDKNLWKETNIGEFIILEKR